MPNSSVHPSRRTLVKGAAWSVPVAVVAGSAPAFASSPIPPNGMNGWVTQRRQCGSGADLFIDGRGRFTGGGPNDRGIWTFVPDPNAKITNAFIIFYFSRNDITFSSGSGAGWTNLVRSPGDDASSPQAGFYAYRTTYTGAWTYYPQHEAWVAVGQPYFSADLGRSCGPVSAYARRTITVNDETVSFLRGPITT